METVVSVSKRGERAGCSRDLTLVTGCWPQPEKAASVAQTPGVVRADGGCRSAGHKMD